MNHIDLYLNDKFAISYYEMLRADICKIDNFEIALRHANLEDLTNEQLQQLMDAYLDMSSEIARLITLRIQALETMSKR